MNASDQIQKRITIHGLKIPNALIIIPTMTLWKRPEIVTRFVEDLDLGAEANYFLKAEY
jgi:hypothetical protein